MHTIFLPILPGRSEAWRRFVQELQGSRREPFAEWCAMSRLRELKIALGESRNAAWMVLTFRDPDAGAACVAPSHEAPFRHWLREQMLALHGIDLEAVLAGRAPDVLLEV